MVKYTKHFLANLEKIVLSTNYKLRYERGVFQSNHCVLHNKKVIIVNKFLSLEGKINVLIEVVRDFRDEILQYPLSDQLKSVVNDCVGELVFNDMDKA